MTAMISPQAQKVLSKFGLGLARLETSRNNQSDPEKAWLSFHGALEDYFRYSLSETPSVPMEIRQTVLDRGTTQWQDLANIAEAYGLINEETKKIILVTNKKRNDFAHGNACEVSIEEVSEYAALVGNIIGHSILISPVHTSQTIDSAIFYDYGAHWTILNIVGGVAIFSVAIYISLIIAAQAGMLGFCLLPIALLGVIAGGMALIRSIGNRNALGEFSKVPVFAVTAISMLFCIGAFLIDTTGNKWIFYTSLVLGGVIGLVSSLIKKR